MRVCKLLLSLSAIVALSACMEKPKGSEASGEGATFRIKTFKTDGTRAIDNENALPQFVKLTLQACLTDTAHNREITQTEFHVSDPSNEANNRVVKTQADGCATWDEFPSFNFLAASSYLEQIREIRGAGLHRGALSWRFAYNPWVIAQDGKLKVINLTAGEQIPQGLAFVRSDEVRKALIGDLSHKQGSFLSFENIKVNLSFARHRAANQGDVFNLAIDGNPILVLTDASGTTSKYPLRAGRLVMQAALVNKVPQAGAGGKKEENDFNLLHAPLLPRPVDIDRNGVLSFRTKEGELELPFQANQGQLYLAIRISAGSLKNNFNEFEQRQETFDALYRIGQANKLRVNEITLERQSLASTKVGYTPSANEQLETQTGVTDFDFAKFVTGPEVRRAADVIAQIDKNRQSNPYFPTYRGNYRNGVRIDELTIRFDSVVAETDTPTQRDVRFSVKGCAYDTTNNMEPVVHAQFHVKNLRGQDIQTTSNEKGCFGWIETIPNKVYDVQHYIIHEYEIENTEFNVKEKVAVAFNPWDHGWTAGRDIRYFLSCESGGALAKGINSNGFSQYGCHAPVDNPICRPGLKPLIDLTPNADGPVHILNQSNPLDTVKDHLPTIACVDEQAFKKYQNDYNQRWSIDRYPKPTLYLSSYRFSFINQDFNIDDELNLNIKRQYILQFEPRVLRQDSLTMGIDGNADLRPGAYLVRIVLVRNRKDPAGRAGGGTRKSAPSTPECKFGDMDAYGRAKDWEYIDKYEAVGLLKDNKLTLPVELEFVDLYMLSARTDMLIQIFPITYKQGDLKIVEDSNTSRTLVVDQKTAKYSLDHNSGLVIPTYRSRFVPVVEHGSDTLSMTCQDAGQVLQFGTGDRKREEGWAPPADALAESTEMFIHDENLKVLDMTAQPDVFQRFADGLRHTSLSHPDPLEKADNESVKQWARNAQSPDLDYNKYPEQIDKLLPYWVSFCPSCVNGVSFLPPTELATRPKPPPILEYQYKRLYLLRNICAYWRSGEIYSDVFGQKNPFRAPQLDWLRGDPCDYPEELFTIDKKVVVRKVSRDVDATEYLGGQSENFNVSKNNDATQRRSDDVSRSRTDSLSWKFYDLNMKVGGDINTENMGPITLPVGLKADAALSAGVSRNRQFSSARSTSLSRSFSNGSAFSHSTYFIVMKMDLTVKVDDYDHCVVIKPKPEFFNEINWRLGISDKDKLTMQDQGLFLCLGLKPNPETDAIRLYENYFFVAQHFNVTAVQDRSLETNRPWMMLIRGTSDYLKFLKVMRDHTDKDHPFEDFTGQSTRSILSAAFEMGVTGDQLAQMEQQPEYKRKWERLKQQSRARYPAYPGLYTMFEDPEFGQPLLMKRQRDKVAPQEDCSPGILNNIAQFFWSLPTGPTTMKSLDCPVSQ